MEAKRRWRISIAVHTVAQAEPEMRAGAVSSLFWFCNLDLEGLYILRKKKQVFNHCLPNEKMTEWMINIVLNGSKEDKNTYATPYLSYWSPTV